MVVLISGKYVEHHPAVKLTDLRVGDSELPHDLSRLLIAVRAGLVEVKVRHRTQRLHMPFAAGQRVTVKAPRHKMIPALFLIQPALIHPDPGILRHQVIGILDSRMLRGIVALFVAVFVHTVELDEPVTVTLARLDLAGANIACLLIPRDDCFCPGSARGGADLDDLLHGIFPDHNMHILTGAQNV